METGNEKNMDPILSELNEWDHMLNLFSKSSGLITSLYLPDGSLISGPHSGFEFGNYLIQNGVFTKPELADSFTKNNIRKVVDTCLHHYAWYENALSVRYIPVISYQKVVGVIETGWVFDHFPDPFECHQLSQILNLSEAEFWQLARTQAPTSQEKFQIHENMLNLLCTTLIKQLIYVLNEKENTRLKDELLATVSHELRTPLTSIQLRIQMLRKNMVRPEKLQDFARSMEASVVTQTRLVEDLLDAAKIITGKFAIRSKSMDLMNCLNDAIETIRPAAEKKNITLILENTLNTAAFTGDPGRLQQAFCNILSNSIKFTPPHGNIRIQISETLSNYILSFKDNGQGIDPLFLPRLFNKFSQFEPKNGQLNSGLGLGLSLVKTIIELHQGRIDVDSEGVNKGTTVEVQLPRKRNEA